MGVNSRGGGVGLRHLPVTAALPNRAHPEIRNADARAQAGDFA